MPSAKSFFNPGLLRKNLARFWPIWGIYFLIWFVVLPLRTVTERSYGVVDGTDILASLTAFGPILAFLCAPAAAMALFSYLFKSRAAGFMSALPMRREGLFLTHYLSGVVFFVGGNAAICLLTAAAQALTPGGDPGAAFLWFAVQSLLCLFFFSFAVFCAMFTGSLAALPIFYGILNFLFPSLHLVISYMLRQYLYGFIGWTETLTEWLWPLAKLIDVLMKEIRSGAIGAGGWSVLLIYTAVGLALSACALLLYRRRHMERAGDVVSVYAVRPVFKYGIAFSAAVLLGSLLFSILASSWNRDSGGWALLLCMVFCGFLGYFAAEMLLRKSLRVWKRGFKGWAAFTLALVLACAVVELDLIGFERRVPDNVVSVQVAGIYSYPDDSGQYATIDVSDPAQIDLVRSIHTEAIAMRDGGGDGSMLLQYRLGSGGELLRQYNSLYRSNAVLDAAVETLINTKAARMQAYAPIGDGVNRPNSSQVILGDRWDNIFSTAETARLYDAVCRDLEAGRIGRRFIVRDATCNAVCTNTQIAFFFGDLEVRPATDGKPQAYYGGGGSQVTITVQTTAVETIRVLAELGVEMTDNR